MGDKQETSAAERWASRNTNGPWLSILVPVYNVERYLQECLESVMTQAGDGVEVIALDDVSTDGSAAVLADFEMRYGAGFKVMKHLQNRGISVARNTLLDAARGRYVWFMDSDDLLLPNAVSELRRIVDREDPDLVLCDYRKLRSKTKLKHRLRGEFHCRAFSGLENQKVTDRSSLVCGLFAPGQMHVWSKVSKRSLWADDLRFPEGKYFEDLSISPRLAIRAQSYYYAPRVWLAYRQREGSIMSTPSAQKLNDRSESLVGFVDEFRRIESSPSAEANFLISHTVAKNFIAAAKSVSGSSGSDRMARLKKYQSDFMRSIAMPLIDIRSGYFKRGWIVRWLRLSYWLRQVAALENGS